MKQSGNVVLFRFPQTNLAPGKPRPALLVGNLPGSYGDWLICMISTQIHQAIPDFDELLLQSDSDFQTSGLKADSAIRVGRLAVAQEKILLGSIGQISPERLRKIRQRLADWLVEA